MSDIAAAMRAALPANIDRSNDREVIVALINTGLWRANEIYLHLDEVMGIAPKPAQEAA